MAHATWVTQSKAVFLGGAKLLRADLVATSSGAATATLHAGVDDAAPVLVQLSAPTSGMRSISFQPGLELVEGLYVKLGSNAQGVLILWEELQGE